MSVPIAKVKGTVKARQREVSAIKEKVQNVIKDKRKANELLEVIAALESEDSAVVNAGIRGLSCVFVHALKQGDMVLKQAAGKSDAHLDTNVERKYKEWLRPLYRENVISRLAELSVESKPKSQKLALSTLLEFLTWEGKKPLEKQEDFPSYILKAVVLAILSRVVDTKNVISLFEEYFLDPYADVKHHILVILVNQFKSMKTHDGQEVYLHNCFNLMKAIQLPLTVGEDVVYLTNREDVEESAQFQFNLVAAKKLYGAMWLNFLKVKLPVTLHRRVLLTLDVKVLVHMATPILLTDFLMDSYSLGGVYRILALNGIFVLMQKHNLEFPNFYTNLYSLLDESVFHTKYSPRFFMLCHLFLTSSHLPEYMVAAFVKRLARLSLTAPPNAALLIIAFVTNLLVRHRSLHKMVHDPQGPKDITDDPFIMDEPDMAKCNANDSSLWEIKTLQQHYNPRVANSARFIDRPLPNKEVDVTMFLELTTSEMITKESKNKKIKLEAPLNFTKPLGLFGNNDNAMKELWTY